MAGSQGPRDPHAAIMPGGGALVLLWRAWPPSPPFTLPEPATGATVSLDGPTGPALVVTFICNHRPYV